MRYTPWEKIKQTLFIDAVFSTDVMSYCYRDLVKKDAFRGNAEQFRTTLHDIWFELHDRTDNNGIKTCAFEHIFAGEDGYKFTHLTKTLFILYEKTL